MNQLRTIKYQPELNQMTGSVMSTLVMGQLEYWFERTGGKPFYKFLAPCEDESYRPGDSWCEEMGFSKAEFRTAFTAIGKVYKTKKAYSQSKDLFEGKPYLSYYDRIRRRTYYIRNNELLATYGITPTEVVGGDSTKSGAVLPITKDYSQDLQTNIKTKDDDKIAGDVHHQIITLYHDVCNDLPKVTGITTKRRDMIDTLLDTLGGSLTKVQAFFGKVVASDFLSGRRPRGDWRASFDWMLRSHNTQAILTGKYDNWKDNYAQPLQSTPAGKLVEAGQSTQAGKLVEVGRSTQAEKLVQEGRSTQAEKLVEAGCSTQAEKLVREGRSTQAEKLVEAGQSRQLEQVEADDACTTRGHSFQPVAFPRLASESKQPTYPAMPSVKGKTLFTTTYTHNWDVEALEAAAYDYFMGL